METRATTRLRTATATALTVHPRTTRVVAAITPPHVVTRPRVVTPRLHLILRRVAPLLEAVAAVTLAAAEAVDSMVAVVAAVTRAAVVEVEDTLVAVVEVEDTLAAATIDLP